jgi:hypothetical protein
MNGMRNEHYDYMLDISGGNALLVRAPDGVVGGHDESETFYTSGKSATAALLRLATQTVATSPAGRSRKTIGVGEEVELRVLPEGLAVSQWTITQGDGDLSYYSGPTTTYTAPGNGGDVTVAAVIEGVDCPAVFHVIEPTGILMENKELGPGRSQATATWMNIAYYANIYLQPDSVSFYRLQIHEGASDVTATGYFTQYDHRMQPHPANGPHFMEPTVVSGKGTLCAEPDNVGGVIDIIDSSEAGDLYWLMSWTWDVAGGTSQKTVETIRQNNHVETINGELRFTITKDDSGYWMSPSSNGPQPVTP